MAGLKNHCSQNWKYTKKSPSSAPFTTEKTEVHRNIVTVVDRRTMALQRWPKISPTGKKVTEYEDVLPHNILSCICL